MRFIKLLVLISIISHAAEYKIGTYNIRNFNYDEVSETETNQFLLANTIREMNPDILAFQEVVDKNNFINFVHRNFNNYSYVLSECGGIGNQHLAFMFKKTKFELINEHEIARLSLGKCHRGLRPGRLIHLRNKVNTNSRYSRIALLNVHLKAGGRVSDKIKRELQYNILKDYLTELNRRISRNIVILGDFNSTDYKTNHNFEELINFQNEKGYHNTTHNLSCSAYWNQNDYNNYLVPTKLDHIIVSQYFRRNYRISNNQIYGHCKDYSCQHIYKNHYNSHLKEVSDHCPILTIFNERSP